MIAEQLNGIAHMDLTALNHITIQSEFAIEFLGDLLEHAMILLERIRVKSGHDASTAQALLANQNLISPAAIYRAGRRRPGNK